MSNESLNPVRKISRIFDREADWSKSRVNNLRHEIGKKHLVTCNTWKTPRSFIMHYPALKGRWLIGCKREWSVKLKPNNYYDGVLVVIVMVSALLQQPLSQIIYRNFDNNDRKSVSSLTMMTQCLYLNGQEFPKPKIRTVHFTVTSGTK